jgi:hypothetical protein
MFWKEHGDSIKHHLTAFYDQYEFQRQSEPDLNLHQYAESYIKNEVAMEQGMDEYYKALQENHKRNDRVLRAIKSVKGKTYYKHFINYLKDAQMTEWSEFEIIREPIGEEQQVTEYGRSIKREWVDQHSVGTEGDGFAGTICLELKPGKYLKFDYSM